MGSIASKLSYLANSINDIQAAINEGGITVDESIALEEYGNLIRKLAKGSSGVADYIPFDEYTAYTELDIKVATIENVSSEYPI